MVETSSTSIRFLKEIAVLVVIAVFVTCPNHRYHGVRAAPNDEYGSSGNSNYQRNFRRGYQLEGDDLYSPYNPLWREEQVYTGERRGPIADPSYRRSRRSDSGNSSPYSPLAPHIQDIDDVSSASSFSEFPLHSADIGSAGSWGNDLHGGHSEKPKRRNWSFPIDFKRKKGRVNIGAPADNARLLAAKTATAKPSSSDVRPSDGDAVTPIQTPPNRTVKTRDDQVTFSLDPFSLATLLGNGATAILGIGSVYVATLKLLGPMILAKHCLTNVNDRFNGRLLGKTSNERLSYTEQNSPDTHDNYGASRAATRTLVQILSMSCAGKAVGFVLDKTPCLLQPFWVCQWWYGVVWLASIYAVGVLCEESVFVPFAQTSNNTYSWLSIKPIPGTIPFSTRKTRVDDQNGRRNMARALFRFSRNMSQNPEEWIHSLFRSVPRWKNRNNYQRNIMTKGEGTESIEVDPLLFPSTWKPLSVVTFLALSRAIFQSFCFDAACTESKQFVIMRSFIVQKVLYSEWHRVFLQERRVELGAGISVIGLFALMWSIYSVSTIDYVAAIALLPTLMARMVNTWISILLACNHIDISSETMTWRNLASRLTTTHD